MTALVRNPLRSGRGLGRVLPGWVLVTVIALLLPQFQGGTASSLVLSDNTIITFLAVLGLNLQFGYGGQVALAQPVVSGAAAYTAGALGVSLGWNALETLPLAIAVGLVASFVVSLASFRSKGWYLAATTFFAVLLFPNLVDLFTTWTGGDSGLIGIPPIPGMNLGLGGTSTRQYLLITAIAMLVFLASITLVESRWGDLVRTLRDAPNGLSASGTSAARMQISIMIIGTIPVALSGWMTASVTGVLVPTTFGLSQLLLLLGSVMVGGRGTIWGPVIGTAIFEVITYNIGAYSTTNQLILGAVLLVIGAAFPLGIWGAVTLGLRRLGIVKPETAAASRPVPASRPAAPATAPGASSTEGHDVVLEAESVTRRFGGLLALDGAHMKLRAGTITGLVGPNGSGKTTLLNVLTGYVVPDEGTVTLDGRPLSKPSPAALARAGVRRSFQTPQLVGELTLRDNLVIGLAGGQPQHVVSAAFRGPGYRRRSAAIERRVHEVAELLAFSGHELVTPVGELSLGQQRIAEVARAVTSSPRVICLDEPAAGLADLELERLTTALARVAESGVAILLIEHNLAFVRKVAHTVVGMESGRVETVDELRAAGDFDVSFESAVLTAAAVVHERPRRPAGSAERAAGGAERATGAGDALVVQGLSAFYGKAQALFDVSLSVGAGEIVGVLGPNGAGKSTLINAIGGVHGRVRGQIEFEGKDLTGLSSVARAYQGLGVVREGARVFPDLTVSEHLAMAKRLCLRRGLEWQGEELLYEWLPVLHQLRDTKAVALSGGQKQLLVVASAAMARPRLLLLDEPSAGLAESTLETVFDYIRRIANDGMTLLIAEQSPRYLDNLVHRFVWLDVGSVVSADSLTTQEEHPGGTSQLAAEQK